MNLIMTKNLKSQRSRKHSLSQKGMIILNFKSNKMKTLIVVLGPTGVGKTELCLSISEHLQTPIINADSRQIFKELRIGSAAPTKEQQKRIPHYFVGNHNIEDYYSAAMNEADVMNLLQNDLFKSHDTALLTGGSMMYIDAVCKGIDDIPT